MHAVVNHLHFKVPVAQLLPAIEQEFRPALAGLEGFHAFHIVQVAEDRAIVLIFWASAFHAQHGANVIGPTLFAKHIAPHLASEQQRSVGEVIFSHPA
jgi:hypothetical protein